jgi:hypothetical protein
MMNRRTESSGNVFRVLGSSRKAELQVDVAVQMLGKRRPVETGIVPCGASHIISAKDKTLTYTGININFQGPHMADFRHLMRYFL